MKNYLPILKRSRLFFGMSESDILSMLKCLNAKKHHYKKGEYVFNQGDSVRYITILVEGSLHIQRDDFWGNRSIVNRIDVGELFAEAYTSPGSCPIPNDVIALENSVVIFLEIERVLHVCFANCGFHSTVIQNLFYAISEKNRKLMQKLWHITERSTRSKLMSYLSERAKEAKSNSFTIPFNRQQLADFLSVDRSAMSNELCKMRDEGLLTFDKNHFTLI